MPYIHPADRAPITKGYPQTPGELNYAITCLVLRYLEDSGTPASYTKFNEAMGALHCASAEIYRRLGSVLEDAAIERNGDLAEFKALGL